MPVIKIELDERSQQILEAVVTCYIASGEPVGSRTISRKYSFGLSPATIRNIMADLEEMGIFMHPHTSAGRIPTELGYRLYVNMLGQRRQRFTHMAGMEKRYLKMVGELEHLLRQISHMLSTSSHYIGVVMAPKLRHRVFKHIDFVDIMGNRVLAIFVSQNGFVEQKVVQLDEHIPQSRLDQMAAYLNEQFCGLALSKVRSRLLELMQEDKLLYDQLLQRAAELSKSIFEGEDPVQVYIDGQLNIMDQPEFADLEKMRSIFRAVEEKGQIVCILDKCVEEEGLCVWIGSESQVADMQDCSLITAPYKAGENVVGALGIIGPKRMPYSNVIPLVEYTAQVVSRVLTDSQK